MRHSDRLLKIAEELLQRAKMAPTKKERHGHLGLAEKYASLAQEAVILEAGQVVKLDTMSDSEVEALAERMVNNAKSTL